MVKLQIESMDLKEEAFAPIVELIALRVNEAFELHKEKKALPRFMKQNQTCTYLNCSYNKLQKYKTMGLRVIMLDGEEKIDQLDADAFMEKHKI